MSIKKYRCLIMGFFLLSFNLLACAAEIIGPLPVDQAFIPTVTIESSNRVTINFQISPNYYLYAKRLRISAEPNTQIEVKQPQGELKYDKLGRSEVYFNSLTFPVLFPSMPTAVTLIINYQGCSDQGFCYPPMQKRVHLDFVQHRVSDLGITAQMSFKSFLIDQNKITALFGQNPSAFLLFLFLGMGLLLAFTPCVLPMIPILTSIIAGQDQTVNARKAFLLSVSYVVGSALTYALAGTLAASLGQSLQVWLQNPWTISVVSILFILLALSLFDLYHLRLPGRVHQRILGLNHRQRGGSYFGVFIMGGISALVVSPCVTAPLVGVLIYIAQTGDRLLGASALFAMGIGMGIPLILIGTSAGKWLPHRGPWMIAIKNAFGLLMLAMAIWLFERVTSPTLATILWGLLILFTAGFFGIYLPKLVGGKNINRILGLLIAVLGMMVIFNGIRIPLEKRHAKERPERQEVTFTIVQTTLQLDQELARAKTAQKPVLLDFYAGWCDPCVEMDKNVFSQSDVKKRLENYVLLRADLTANTAEDQALMKRFQVIAPPTVVVFDANGQEVVSKRMVGEMDANEFLERLNAPH